MLKKITGLFMAALLMVSGSAFAVIDVTAVTAGITDAQTALAVIIAAFLALSVAILGLSKVYAFVRRRAGA